MLKCRDLGDRELKCEFPHTLSVTLGPCNRDNQTELMSSQEDHVREFHVMLLG